MAGCSAGDGHFQTAGERRLPASARYIGVLPDDDWYTFERHSLTDRKPVQLTQDERDMVATFCSSDEARGGVLN